MWGVVSIFGFLGAMIADATDRHNHRVRNGYRPNTNQPVQEKFYDKYVRRINCVTKDEFVKIKEETLAEFGDLENPEILETMLETLDSVSRRTDALCSGYSNNRMPIYPPALKKHELVYFIMTQYERYELAKERFRSETGYTWAEEIENTVPASSPNEDERIRIVVQRRADNINYQRRRNYW